MRTSKATIWLRSMYCEPRAELFRVSMYSSEPPLDRLELDETVRIRIVEFRQSINQSDRAGGGSCGQHSISTLMSQCLESFGDLEADSQTSSSS